VKSGNLLWPPDVRDRALVVAFLCIPLLFAILSALARRQPIALHVAFLVLGAWLVIVGILLAIPSASRGSLPRLLNLGIVLTGLGAIAIGVSSTRPDLATFAILDVGGLVVALAGLVLAGSTAMGSLVSRRF